jgi:hypothetical protein
MSLTYWALFELLCARRTRDPAEEATDALAALPPELWVYLTIKCDATALWRYSQCCARASRDLRRARWMVCAIPEVPRGQFNRFLFGNYVKPRVVDAVLDCLKGPQQFGFRKCDRRFLVRGLTCREATGPGYTVRLVPAQPARVERASSESIEFRGDGGDCRVLVVRGFDFATQRAGLIELEYDGVVVTARIEGPAVWVT